MKMRMTINPVATIQGEMRPPSDKSLTHRAYLFASIADGECVVRTPLFGEDCESTLRCLEQMGLEVQRDGESVVLNPVREWSIPSSDLDCGNSGTTVRLLAGLVASRPLKARFVGDASLSRRPMGRVAAPLRLMGAGVEGETLPLTLRGGQLKGIAWSSPVASAQVKSCVLLAGLRAEGRTSVTEPAPSRDHTERMLTALGVPMDGLSVVGSDRRLDAFDFAVPGDISSAAFFLVAAALLPQSDLVAHEVGVNPGRSGIFDVFEAAGVPFGVQELPARLDEPVADLRVGSVRSLKAFTIEGALVPRLIDEIPVLAVLATQCEGTSVIRNAEELRVKESDRIEVVADGLRRMGASIETTPDGMTITGPTRLSGITINARGDHRIAMAFAVAGLIAKGTTTIDGAESVATSFPGFEEELMRLCIV